MIELTRCYRFPAAHVLANPALGDARNEAIFGKCANPNGHGHDYGVEVTVTGEIGDTGELVPIDTLDAAFDASVREPFSHRMLNDLEAFEGLVPTAENIALVLHARLGPEIEHRSAARLARVRVIETPRNSFEVRTQA